MCSHGDVKSNTSDLLCSHKISKSNSSDITCLHNDPKSNASEKVCCGKTSESHVFRSNVMSTLKSSLSSQMSSVSHINHLRQEHAGAFQNKLCCFYQNDHASQGSQRQAVSPTYALS
ncbi:unnamed protein product [Schistosoma curassoni]|uniref:Ovule protein n=1 Tax=Schistosoma curassoni TaxID=6186 RepID=A0A183JTS8_9TREM|nr:unnamed protein product [Schistosoma curassoni]